MKAEPGGFAELTNGRAGRSVAAARCSAGPAAFEVLAGLDEFAAGSALALFGNGGRGTISV